MPLSPKLPGLLIIIVSFGLASAASAMGDLQPAKPTAQTNSTKADTQRESISNEFPFNNQSIPSAKVSTPDTPQSAPTAQPVPVVDSKAEVRKVGNGQCTGSENNGLQKSLLITAFPRLTPITSNAGSLADVEHQLPQLISEQLVAKQSAIAPIQFNESLPSPTISNDNLLAQQIQKLARDQRTQLVLSGEIIDMSMAHPEATYNPGVYTRVVNSLFDVVGVKTSLDKRDRLLSLRIDLRDGFTGQSLLNKRYDTYGIWNLTENTGFGSPLFWQSDYGRQIKGLVKHISKEVSQVIQCQPFIAQIDSRPGQTQIILQGGANNGLHSGDTLALYQLVVQGSETQYEQHLTRLVNRNAAIELREVYPSHSVGVISGTTYLTGQFLAVAP